jgi:hypothetical protein
MEQNRFIKYSLEYKPGNRRDKGCLYNNGGNILHLIFASVNIKARTGLQNSLKPCC